MNGLIQIPNFLGARIIRDNLWFFLFRRIVFLSLLLIFGIFFIGEKSVFGESVENKAFEDQEPLFNYLFKRNAFAYSLFGNKPLSFEFVPHEMHLNFERIKRTGMVFFEGFTPYKPIRIINNKFSLFSINNKHKICIIINKSAMRRLLNKNKNLFKTAFGFDITSAKIIKKLENGEIDILKIGHYPLGVMLGYGKKNAFLFSQLYSAATLNPNRFVNASNNFALQCLQKDDPWVMQCLVNFAILSTGAETEKIRTYYKNLSKEVTAIYSRPDWFQLTIDKLYSD